ncbi:hypothetical protein BH20ACT8_BH20ACT8_17820 [soil metagenome]
MGVRWGIQPWATTRTSAASTNGTAATPTSLKRTRRKLATHAIASAPTPTSSQTVRVLLGLRGNHPRSTPSEYTSWATSA